MEQPQAPKQQEQKPEYILVNDVTGKPPEPRGPQILEIYGEKVRVPHPPNKKCKKCYGRGYLGRDATTGMIIFCHKCFNV